MYRPFNDTVAPITPFLTALSHNELLTHLTNGFVTFDATAVTSLHTCPYSPATPPFPLPVPAFQPAFCYNPPSAPLPTPPAPHHLHPTDILAASTSTAAEMQERVSALPRLSRKSKLKETVESADGSTAVGGDPKRYRTTYSPYQSRVLEEVFQTERYISRPQRAQLATQLQLPENTIKVWFQNRRMKEKRQSMMLPSIAGNDPYLRETLLHVAKLYCDYQQKQQQLQPEAEAETAAAEVGPGMVMLRSEYESVPLVDGQEARTCKSSLPAGSPSPPAPSTSTSTSTPSSAAASSFSVDSLCPSVPPRPPEKPSLFRLY